MEKIIYFINKFYFWIKLKIKMDRKTLHKKLNNFREDVFKNIQSAFNDKDKLSSLGIDINDLVLFQVQEQENILQFRFAETEYFLKSELFPINNKMLFKTFVKREDFTRIPSKLYKEEIDDLVFNVYFERTSQTFGEGKRKIQFKKFTEDYKTMIGYIKLFIEHLQKTEKEELQKREL